MTLAAFPAVIPGTSPRDAPAYLGTHHKMCHTNRPRVLRVLIVAVFFVVGTVTPVRATDGALHANTTNGTALPECTCCQEAMKRRGYVDDTCSIQPPGQSADKPAASASTILAAYPNSQSGVYWIKIQGGVGAKEVYCDMTNGGWMLVMRGIGADNIPYGDARWTASDEFDAHNLLTPEFGTFAKSAAFASYDLASRVLVVAGGFSGANADGKFRSFEFDFWLAGGGAGQSHVHHPKRDVVEFVVRALEIHLWPRPVKRPYVSTRRKQRKPDHSVGQGRAGVRYGDDVWFPSQRRRERREQRVG